MHDFQIRAEQDWSLLLDDIVNAPILSAFRLPLSHFGLHIIAALIYWTSIHLNCSFANILLVLAVRVRIFCAFSHPVTLKEINKAPFSSLYQLPILYLHNTWKLFVTKIIWTIHLSDLPILPVHILFTVLQNRLMHRRMKAEKAGWESRKWRRWEKRIWDSNKNKILSRNKNAT